MTRYMVIERIFDGCQMRVYERLDKQGRMIPNGLQYIDSWLEKDGNRCFQLMETDDFSLFHHWTRNWEDLVEFEIVELGNKPEK